MNEEIRKLIEILNDKVIASNRIANAAEKTASAAWEQVEINRKFTADSINELRRYVDTQVEQMRELVLVTRNEQQDMRDWMYRP